MRDFLTLVLFLFGGVLGGIVGYNIGTYNMRQAAIAHNAAYWSYTDRQSTSHPGQTWTIDEEFAWRHEE